MTKMTTDSGIVILAVDCNDKNEANSGDKTHDIYKFKKEVQHEMVDANIIIFLDDNYVKILKEVH